MTTDNSNNNNNNNTSRTTVSSQQSTVEMAVPLLLLKHEKMSRDDEDEQMSRRTTNRQCEEGSFSSSSSNNNNMTSTTMWRSSIHLFVVGGICCGALLLSVSLELMSRHGKDTTTNGDVTTATILTPLSRDKSVLNGTTFYCFVYLWKRFILPLMIGIFLFTLSSKARVKKCISTVITTGGQEVGDSTTLGGGGAVDTSIETSVTMYYCVKAMYFVGGLLIGCWWAGLAMELYFYGILLSLQSFEFTLAVDVMVWYLVARCWDRAKHRTSKKNEEEEQHLSRVL